MARRGPLSCTLLLAVACAGSVKDPGPPVLHEEFPFPELRGTTGDRAQVEPSAEPRLLIRVATDLSGREVTFSWYLHRPGSRPEDQAWSATAKQVEPCAFWPTAAMAVSPTEWVVAGHDEHGVTSVERWDVALPVVETDAEGREHLHPSPVARSGLLATRQAGQTAVCLLEVHRGAARSVLLQFWDSRDVYSLDVDSAALTLQVSATPRPDVPSVPELAEGYRPQVWAGDHVAHGHTYLLMNLEEMRTPIALFDGDRDGTIDRAFPVDAATSVSMGLSDGTRYR